jgi:TRAP-type C4-dicarboxylate transport system substrate-binding protein
MRWEHQCFFGRRHLRGLRALGLAAAACFALGCATDTQRIELKVSDPNPAGTTPALAMDAWAKQVTQQSGGRLTLTVYHGATLLSTDELFTGVQTGIADFGVYVSDIKDGLLKDDLLLNNIVTLPFMGWPDQRKTGQIYLGLLAAYPELQAEWKGLKVVGVAMMAGVHIHNVVRDITTPADLNGLKTVAAAGVLTDSAHAAGAIGVQVDITQMATAVANGTVEAVIDHFAKLAVNNVLQPFTHHTLFGDGGINMTPLIVIVNRDVFNSLSADLQDIVTGSGSFYADQFYALDGPLQAASVAQAVAWNQSFVSLTPEEITVWYELVKVPVHDQWITTCAVNGLPGQALYDDTLQRIQAAASP